MYMFLSISDYPIPTTLTPISSPTSFHVYTTTTAAMAGGATRYPGVINTNSDFSYLDSPSSDTQGRVQRKHVGMRYLFPHLPDSMSLLEKTKIWAERHTQGYFVGWTEEQLKTVDPLIRPLTVVSEEIYKQHMNR